MVGSNSKKNKKSYGFLSIFLLAILGAFILGFILLVKKSNAITISQNLVSPVGVIARLSFADNLWFPQAQSNSNVLGAQNLNLTASSAFFVDTTTGQVLYEKNAHQQMRIASLTKIMTVIIGLENKNFSDQFLVSQNAANTQPDKMFLKSGETLSLEELLDGVFLISANDAAETIAEDTTGDRSQFILEMNQKAVQLGMVDTKFINPTGLEEDDPNDPGREIDQHSSAYDVALMSRYAISHWPHLIDISSNPHIFLPTGPNHQDYDLVSGINLLTTYPGVVGFKTGFTPEAGLTLVTVARKGGHQILGVLLNAEDRREDARTLLDYCFKEIGVSST